MKKLHALCLLICICMSSYAQQIQLQEIAPASQVYGTQMKSEELLPMNDLNGNVNYVLYEASVNISSPNAVLEVENIRDYAVVYTNRMQQGMLTPGKRKMTLSVIPGHYVLRLYVKCAGRSTYNSRMQDSSKGLFNFLRINGTYIQNWEMTELQLDHLNTHSLSFASQTSSDLPCFRRGYFQVNNPLNCYLNTSGWGMGEVWVNGKHIGSYSAQDDLRSIEVPASVQIKGRNSLVVFEFRKNQREAMWLSNRPISR